MAITFSVGLDEDTTDPRDDMDMVPMFIYRAGRGDTDSVEDADLTWADGTVNILGAFQHFFDRFKNADMAIALANRWARVCGVKYEVATRMIHGYAQSDWWSVAYVVEPYADVDLKTLGMYLRGDIYVVSASGDYECACAEKLSRHEHDYPEESLGGIYADSAEDAVKKFCDNGYPRGYDETKGDEILPSYGYSF